MRKSFFLIFLGVLFLANFAFAQKTKTYSQMAYDEKLRFVAAESDKILSLFGRTEGDEMNQEGLKMIMNFLDSYARRATSPTLDSCSTNMYKSDLMSVIKRGSKNAAVINEEFSGQKIPAQVGLYVAMIESEFCPCVQAPTGTLGMFQLVSSTAKDFGIQTKENATPQNPDDRCNPQFAARASSKFLRKMIDDTFGNDAVGLPMAISAFNSGDGLKKRHIADVALLTKAKRISFWVLIDTQDKLREKFDAEKSEAPVYFKQFEMENIKYVPKFFAAAIIGENPKTFGINMMPLSSYKN